MAFAIIPLAAAAFPSKAGTLANVGFSGGLEAYHLREIESTGTRLLSETGNRYTMSIFIDSADQLRNTTPLIFHVEASGYFGRVNYDGKSQSIDPVQSNIPLKSNTTYQGGRVEGLLGYQFDLSNSSRAFEFLGGLGTDFWNRHIDSTVTNTGVFVSGIDETYRVYYGKAAFGIRNPLLSSWQNRLRLGIKVPFRIDESIDLKAVGYDNNLKISPGNNYSFFITFSLNPKPTEKKSGVPIINAYYDSYRFNPSKSKTATRNGIPIQVWQPETHIDIIGLQIGYRF